MRAAWPLISVAVIVAVILLPKPGQRNRQARIRMLLDEAQSRQQVAIVAVKTDPKPWEIGLVYFDESDWPVPGFTLIKCVTGATASDLRAHHRKASNG